MRIMSYNTLFGGFDGADGRRAVLQAQIIRDADPDILLLQELKNFLDSGAARLFALERSLGMRALVAPAPHTGQNVAILTKPEIEILSFEADSTHFHHAAAIAQLRVPHLDQTLTAISVHLCPNGPAVRIREATYLANFAVENGLTVIGGDFNSVSPHDPEPALGDLPPRFRFRYAAPDGTADRSTNEALERAGFVDLGFVFRQNGEPTVPGAAFEGTEFVPFRCDYLFATPVLADRVQSYQVVRGDPAGAASDHHPILCDLA